MIEAEDLQRSAQHSTRVRLAQVMIRIGLLLLVLASLVFLSGERRSEWGWAYPGSLAERQRYGFVALSTDWRQTFDIEQLGAGWYVDANPPACAINSGGMDRALLIRVLPSLRRSQAWLEAMVDAHPASLWLVGNEPDCIWQDNLLPEDYAQAYYDIYWTIKDRDPTALVSPGGIVQPTPLRLAWLDRVLEAYAEIAGNYGKDTHMPVDVWNIHNQILQEVRDSWGADIPPGFDGINEGALYTMAQNADLGIFKDHVFAFREWMAANDYGGWPLIISEFGVLMPAEFGFDVEDVNKFMDDTFTFLRTETSGLGDTDDGYRLVQRWAWFSLDNPPYDPDIPMTFNGNLFDPYTTYITEYGLHFATHTNSLSPLEYVELRPGGLSYEPLGPVGEGELVTRKVEVEAENLGSLDSGPFVVRLSYSGPASGELQRTVPGLPAESSAWLEFELAGLSPGGYTIVISVDADDQVFETTECDNMLESFMVVPTDIMYLPMVFRKY